MKLTGWLVALLVAAYGALVVAQIWWKPLSGGMFWKVSLTWAIALAVVIVVGLVRREMIQESRQRKKGYLD